MTKELVLTEKNKENPYDKILSIIQKKSGCRCIEIQSEFPFQGATLSFYLRMLVKQGKILRLGKISQNYRYFLPDTLFLLKKCVYCGETIIEAPILKNIYFPNQIYCSDDCAKNDMSLSIDDLEQISNRIEELKQSGVKGVVDVPKIHEFIEYLQGRTQYTKSTIIVFRIYIQQFFRFLARQNLMDISVSSITKDDILAFLEENFSEGLGCNTIQLKFNAFQRFFDFCLEMEWIEKSPVENPSAITRQISLWFK